MPPTPHNLPCEPHLHCTRPPLWLLLAILWVAVPFASDHVQADDTSLTGLKTSIAESSEQSPVSEETLTEISTALLNAEALFTTNADILEPEGRQALQKLVEDLRSFQNVLSIRIVGHTDSIGSAEYNLALSQRRARAIGEVFASNWPESHIVAIGAGESSPIASNATLAGQQRNRRVEIQVIATGVRP